VTAQDTAPPVIRSELALYDLDGGQATTILATPRLIEAPNWMPDGQSLLVNAEGLLWRVPLSAPALLPLDTGLHQALNNDHVPSPDGRWIAFCDKSEQPHSCLYLMPADCTAPPHRLTANTPSWLHGWSPDSQRLVYAGVRAGAFGLWSIALTGGEERCIYTGPGHHDGPDMTPDGHWVWFNSDMGGTMQLWRIRPDGSDLQQMTDEASVNWFPHPTPCGRHVLYLAYASGTHGHPRDCRVSLRLMPANGGHSRLLAPLFGGQGSLNVPCWSPDSRRFAFVRYHLTD
jgi:Tol biopolymer transport system component